MEAAHPTSPLLYKNDRDLRIFESGRKDRYTVREAVEILFCETEKRVK